MTGMVLFSAVLLTYLGAPVCFRDWRKTGARLARFVAVFLRQSAPVLESPFRGSRLAQLAQTDFDRKIVNETGAKRLAQKPKGCDAMTNPLITALDETIKREKAMTDDQANDRREGYADGIADHAMQQGRTLDYVNAWLDGKEDANWLRLVAA